MRGNKNTACRKEKMKGSKTIQIVNEKRKKTGQITIRLIKADRVFLPYLDMKPTTIT